ncbi:cell morphogenesis protein-like protein Sog2 [Massarina eburnea CBS 473.64]|uniref:Cell morphogenesis protein-like protein Sog2 n=1 Tax=Massarina eburnea CBS 473.64 TaxID=1395130 RepID=A0A6A6RIN9_9PLEO|nr:cell morphogenesis protein-like protein Sog2 [Massarina eburnea CBS 473.64]
MSNDAAPISDEEVVALAKAAFVQSREDISHRAHADSGAREQLQQQPGITIDLGHKGIVRLPDEVIDVIRIEIERLALSHNLLSTLPNRLIECKRLRYLNVRYNLIREIPDAILQMTSLEILDVSRNRLKSIPAKIANLTSLKVLAIAKNKIETLPVCLGEINSLQVLKLDGNPLTFPPPEVCTLNTKAPLPANENERDAVIATQVKKFMRQQATKEKQRMELERVKVESSSDESWTESNPETPRPSRRTNGGRFPVKPSVGSVDGFPEGNSPGMPPPPIPIRSHYRVASQTNGMSRRPNISPLILTNVSNERNRSQSDGSGSGSQRQSKRMAIHAGKGSELGSVAENRRTSHFRGFSQGFAYPSNVVNGMSGPATAIGYGDTGTVRSLANRPLSDVREHKRGSKSPDIVVEASKNFLYAISQLHDPILHMMRSMKRTARTKEDLSCKENFYRRFSSTYLNVRALSEVLLRFDTLAEEDEEDAQKLSKYVYQYAVRCLDAFLAVSLSIAENRVEITANSDPRILRSFLFLQQSSLVEMRSACQILGAEFRDTTMAARKPNNTNGLGTIRPRPLMKTRKFQMSPPQRNGYQVPPPVILHSNENSRSNTMTSLISATPRSGESFSTLASSVSRSNTLTSTFEEADDDAQFERIYSKVRMACEKCQVSIPQILGTFKGTYEQLRREIDSEHPRLKTLVGLIEKSHEVQQMTGPLYDRLNQMQLGDSYSRNQPDFWQQCMGFIKSWGELASASSGQGRNMGLLSSEVRQLMKPLHKTVKEASVAINDSPWSHLTSNNTGIVSSLSSFTSRTQPPRFLNKPTMTSGGGPSFPGPINTSISSVSSAFAHPYSSNSFGSQGSGGYMTPVPATPLSAALGAAAQATVPNTSNPHGLAPSNTISFNERADRYLSSTARRI